MKTEKPPVAEDQHQSQIVASLRLSEAKLAALRIFPLQFVIFPNAIDPRGVM
jgi:hypothetical protein